ncbi:transglutaminase-like cysteine peptidase [Rhizobium sp. BK379]|jgi:predicted transglutaminase-like cysteine proteinase|uniref:transglutaminase-like cysteine peptidase n=1 Tax=Rhizobium sp. BK379 TaxID=2587059 RepID=UPI000DD660BB|nr:transglutaminase-like cysteine peptidase [Rhizobium sp. BK379]MBB3441194.1 putative transglutaminase-like cysteine proteinase [Rhizobium sp. BK379]
MRWIFCLVSLVFFPAQFQAFAGQPLPVGRNIGAPVGFASACASYRWLCHETSAARRARGPAEQAGMPLLRKVTRAVNLRVRSTEDSSISGNGDAWTLPVGGRGDCEDYALQKMKDLIDAGFPASRLALSVVIGPHDENHVVLIARLDDGDYVLDNLNNAVKPWRATPYTFLATQDFRARTTWRVTLAGPRAGEFS